MVNSKKYTKNVSRTRKTKGNKNSKRNNNIKMGGKQYEKSILEPWFSLIQNGIKKVEGRPKKKIFNELKKNDIVTWTNDITGKVRKCKTLITDVRYYDTFHDMIATEKLINVLPAPGAGIKTVEDGVNKVYRQWYNVNVEKTYGVCAIEMKVID